MRTPKVQKRGTVADETESARRGTPSLIYKEKVDMKGCNCHVYENGKPVELADAELPSGHWIIVTEDEKVVVSGPLLSDVDDKGMELGLDMERVTLRQVPPRLVTSDLFE